MKEDGVLAYLRKDAGLLTKVAAWLRKVAA